MQVHIPEFSKFLSIAKILPDCIIAIDVTPTRITYQAQSSVRLEYTVECKDNDLDIQFAMPYYKLFECLTDEYTLSLSDDYIKFTKDDSNIIIKKAYDAFVSVRTPSPNSKQIELTKRSLAKVLSLLSNSTNHAKSISSQVACNITGGRLIMADSSTFISTPIPLPDCSISALSLKLFLKLFYEASEDNIIINVEFVDNNLLISSSKYVVQIPASKSVSAIPLDLQSGDEQPLVSMQKTSPIQIKYVDSPRVFMSTNDGKLYCNILGANSQCQWLMGVTKFELASALMLGKNDVDFLSNIFLKNATLYISKQGHTVIFYSENKQDVWAINGV